TNFLTAPPGQNNIKVVQGSLSSNIATFTILAPPFITSISPGNTNAGSPAFTLTVNDTGGSYASGDVIQWNGTALTTTFVNSTQLTATVSGTLVAAPGTAAVTVARGSVVSNSKTFLINSIGPPPVISSLNPPSAIAGGAGFVLTV